MNLIDKMKRFIRLTGVWIIKILFGHSHFKVSIFKRIYYAINGGFMPDQVVLYNLNKKNKKEYLSEFDWYKSRYINGKYGKLLDNKIVCSDLLKSYVKIPTIFFIKKDKSIVTYDGVNASVEDVLKRIEKTDLYIKPISAGKGNGVNRFSYADKKYYIDLKPVTKEELISFINNRNNWFISECINQASFLNKIYDKTSNTIRIISIRDKNTGKCKIINAVQRIGTHETIPVDNGSRGGLVASIDVNTGELSSAKSIQKICDYEVHPDSGNPIKGVKIENWTKVKKEIVSLMEKLPYINFIAWDVLLIKDGIAIIEANSSSGINIVQMWEGQRNKELGDFYRSHGIIK